MPASDFNMFCVQDARNNFDVIRPAPICSDTNQLMGHCQKIHISTNYYYGYHDQKNTIARGLDNSKNGNTTDYEMMEVQVADVATNGTVSPQGNMRKRSGDDVDYPKNKRIREDESAICSLVGTRSSPNHSASAFNVNTPKCYLVYFNFKQLVNSLCC